MLDWRQLYQNLVGASNRYKPLASRFEEFAKLVESQVAQPAFYIKGITTSLHLDQGYFTTTFAGHTIVFSFTSLLEGNGSLKGNVQCYLKKEFPEPLHVKICEFNFDDSGRADLKAPDKGIGIFIDDDDRGALHTALHFIHESLSI